MGSELDAYKDDPKGFFKNVLNANPHEKQEEILQAVSRRRRVSVVGCNSSGKDWAAGRIVLWWMHTRSPSKAVVTGPTTRQVNDIVWSELRHAYQDAAEGMLDGRLFRSSRYEVDGRGFAIGFASNSPYNLQGFHSPNLLVVVTEAHAVNHDDMNALLRLNPSLLLLTGNAFTVDGAFFDSHHGQSHRYGTVRIAAHDTPNVKHGWIKVPGLITEEDVQERKEDWGEDSQLYRGAILAEFPDSLENTFVSAKDVRAAVTRSLDPHGPVIVACDVARQGPSKTVVISRQGPVVRVVHKGQDQSITTTAKYLKDYADCHQVDFLVVDDVGVGGGVIDILRDSGCRAKLVPFGAGEKPEDRRYFTNKITECLNRMARRYEAGDMDTEGDDRLIAQVIARKYKIMEDGRRKAESKEKGAASPDEADALAMTFAVKQEERMKIWV